MKQMPLFETRDDALAAFESARPDWLSQARAAAEMIAHQNGGLATIDDVRHHCPPPEDADPRVMGAVFNTNKWRPVGLVNSKRNTCHKRPIRVFRLLA